MAVIVIRPTAGGSFGPLDGPFTLVAEPEDATLEAIVISFARQVSSGMSFYNNQAGFAESSLFKSYAAECFAELEDDDPASAARLGSLTLDCRSLDEKIRANKMWQLHRAILATLPDVRFLD